MKRRPLRLDRLARVRSIQERVARAAWGEAEAAARAAHRRLVDLRGEIAAAREHTSTEQAEGRLLPREVLAADRAHGSLLRALTGQRRRELALRGTADAERRAWSKRDRERESLERLREREALRRRAEAEERAARELDEIALGRRRSGGSGPAGAPGTSAAPGSRFEPGSGPVPGAGPRPASAARPDPGLGSSRSAGAADTSPSGPGRARPGDPDPRGPAAGAPR